ncbi:MAG: CRISPR-associated endoribonuclease Cas6 [Prevotellaceae bacterium]|jgi:CRISPR-associated endoribonuclease Cas6|nr:CRISPR-associated endoribonuclease Cas6 [Prevotellaceae bacterium]
MRFKLTLQVEASTFRRRLAFDYQSDMSAMVYGIMTQSDSDYEEWLHVNGFHDYSLKFKMFTFSKLIIPDYSIDRRHNCMIINSESVEFFLSLVPERRSDAFIPNMFKGRRFRFNEESHSAQFTITQVDVVPDPVFEREMEFCTLSPVCIQHNTQVANIVMLDLLSKYRDFYGNEYKGVLKDFSFNLLNKPEDKVVVIRSEYAGASNIRASMFDFKIIAPPALLKIMYSHGLGNNNCLGFGMIAPREVPS